MTEPTNEELAEALRSIEGLPLGTRLVVRLAADRLSPRAEEYDFGDDPDRDPWVGEDGWVEWGGQICPTIFKPGQIVETRHRDGMEFTGVGAWPWDEWYDATEDGRVGFWVHDDTDSNIVAYRVVK
jgi:hypothetical protein